jgi:two-component system response regulator YesN
MSSLLSQIEKHYPFSQLEGLCCKVKEAFRYTEEHFKEEEISLEKVASEVRLKPASLCKEIHEEMRKRQIPLTWKKYLNGIKIKGAIVYLKDHKFAHDREVMHEVGYHDLSHFRRMFGRYYGIRLSKFKKGLREGKIVPRNLI